jgi:hypothetical protein
MNVKYHFCREKVERGDIEVHYCATYDMMDGVLTKRLVSGRHEKRTYAIIGFHE